MIAIGEVQTGLLQHSAAVSSDFASRLLATGRGTRVRRAERPIAYAVSPDLITGVDCDLGGPFGPKVRGVGTTLSRVAITGGHVVQGSAYARVGRGDAGRRLPW